MTSSSSQKRRRHVPQAKAQHIYWSERSDGSKVFEVRHPRNAEGKRLYEVVGSRLDEAKARAREVYGEATPRVASVGVTLAEAIAYWREVRDVRPASARVYDTLARLYIEPKLGRRKVRELDEAAILAWLRGLKGQKGQPLSDSTRRLLLSVLDAIFQRALRRGWASVNPVRQLDKRDRPKQGRPRRRVLGADEERSLLLASRPWLRPVILITRHEALRLGEALGLEWSDVDFTAGTLHVRRAVDRRGALGPCKGQTQDDFERGKGAKIELMPKAREALLALRADSDGTGPVFRNGRGGRRGLGDVQRAFRKARERAALPVTEEGEVVFHSLRHTGISRLANHPAIPLVHVRDFARHADLVTTQGYVHKIENAQGRVNMAEAMA